MKLADITSVYRTSLIHRAYKNWVSKNDTVLDIGCGTGVVAYELDRFFKFKKLIGCDIENYLISDIKFEKMNSFTKLPFKKNDFDISMFNDVLHHTPFKNQIKLIKEAVRVSKKVLVFELKPTFLGKKGDYLINKIHNPNMNIPYTYRTQDEWEELFKRLGLIFDKRSVKSPVWYPFKHIAYRLRLK